MVTERGFAFGYNNLVVDFKGLTSMRRLGFPIVFDATHTRAAAWGCRKFQVQVSVSSFLTWRGRRSRLERMGFFLEVHDDPDRALSDGPNALQIDSLEDILKVLKRIDALVKGGEDETER